MDRVKVVERRFDEIYSNQNIEVPFDETHKRWWVLGYLQGEFDKAQLLKAWGKEDAG